MSSHGDSHHDRFHTASPTIDIHNLPEFNSPPPAFSSVPTPIFPPSSASSSGTSHVLPTSSLTRSDPTSSLKRPGSPLLRKTHSFKLDEGYGEGVEESQSFHDSLHIARNGEYAASYSEAADIKIPDWMMELGDDVRKELAYKLVRSLPTSAIASIVERLIPVLHLDFVALLPSELSLQILSYLPPRSLLNASLASKTWRKFAMEPRLWKGLYRAEGWSLNDEEAFEFEREMRGEGKRKLQQDVESFMRQRYNGINGTSAGASTDNLSTAATMGSEARSPMSSFSTGQQPTPPTSFQTNTPDEEDLYPAPFPPQHANPVLVASSSCDPANVTSITTYGLTHPRLNWAFVFRNRRKLEENWRTNKYVSFQMPDPAYAHEGHSECIYTIQHSAKYLLSGSRDRSIKIWNIHTRRLVKSLTGHEGSVLCLQFDDSPQEDVIFSGSSDTNVIVWRFSTGERLKTITKAHSESVLNLRFNKKYVVTCSKDKCVKVWSRNELHYGEPEFDCAVRQIQLGNNRLIEPSQLPHYIQLTGHSRPTKDLPSLTLIHNLIGHNAAVNAIQLNGEEVVSASGDRLIKLWNLKTGHCEKTYVGHKKGIACIQYDGVKIVSGSSDKSIRVWDKSSQAEIARLEGHDGLVRTVQAGGPRNARIVSGGYDETIRIWRREDENGELDDGENPGIFGSLRDGVHWRTTGILRHVNEVPPARPHAHPHPLAQAAAAAAMQPAPPAPPQNVPVAPPPNHGNPALNAAQNAFVNVGAQNNVPALAAPLHALPPQFNIAPIPPPNVHQLLPQPWNPQNHGIAAPAVQNQNKVFKLQFDARYVWCCSQDMRIVGWDFAANDPDIIEASRFF